jgi:Protein of unknown function (DUF2851)
MQSWVASLQHVYAFQSADFWVAEATVPTPRSTPEKLVRCLWFDQRWRPATLRTVDGQDVVVHTPGRWNAHAGPDFQHAVIEFAAGGRQRGDVEVHRYASGWTAHRHDRDGRYGQVILHVFLWNDRQTAVARRVDGQTIPQIELAAHLSRPPETYLDAIALDDYPSKYAPMPGRCYEALRQLDGMAVQAFLNRAGDVRLHRRMQRWARRVAEVGLAQSMYEAVLRSLGSTGYRQQFQRLASLVTWQELHHALATVPSARRETAAEALLLGLAGLLPQGPAAAADMDHDTQRYSALLQQYWHGFPRSIQQRAWGDELWRQPHVRPGNTPERRLAAMAHLLARYHATDLLQAALSRCQSFLGHIHTTAARRLCNALIDLLVLPATSYWSAHARLGSRQGRPQRLIGTQRALTIVVDAMLPVLLLSAQGTEPLHATLLACYQAAPRLPHNYLLRYMARRLLGDDPALLSLVTGSRQQQGMLQIFYDYCDNDEGNCQGCDFPHAPAPLSQEHGASNTL